MTNLLQPRTARWIIALLLALAVTVSAGGVARASSNTQVILSATGINSSGGPAGFWIWSQPGNNNYGNDGNGSIYFYALLPAEHPVNVSKVVVSGETVAEEVTSRDGLITCPTFTGTETSPGHGTVTFICDVTTPTGVVVAAATNAPAQVNISH